MFTLNELRLSDEQLEAYRQQHPPHGKKRRLLLWNWVQRAAPLGHAARAIAFLLACHADMHCRTRNLTVSTSTLRAFHIKRQTYYATLQQLEVARLVSVVREPGRKARVTIIGIAERESA